MTADQRIVQLTCYFVITILTSSCEVCFCSCEVDRIVFYSEFSIWGAMCAPHVRSSGQQQVKVVLVKSLILIFLACNMMTDNT